MMDYELDYIGGNCPVQAEGTIDGHAFYIRARGMHITADIHQTDPFGEGTWFYEEEYGDGPYAAGWAPEADVLAFMDRAFAKWRASRVDA